MQWCWSWWYNGEDYGDYAGDDGNDYKEWRHRVKICFAFIKVGLVGVFLNGLVIIGVRTNRSSSTWSWWCHHHRHNDGHQDDDDDHYIGSGSLTRRSTTCYSGFARPPCLRQPSGFLQSASFLVTSHLSAYHYLPHIYDQEGLSPVWLQSLGSQGSAEHFSPYPFSLHSPVRSSLASSS